MGLIKAALGSFGGSMADTWKEFFTCDALDADILVAKGEKQTSGRSSNKRGHDNVITNGSGIAVADGQCMIIVDQGEIVEICAEPGQFTYDTSAEPSVFTGDFGDSLKETFATMGKRFTYGGDTARDQRVYYFNTKEILDNKFGTANPFMFRIVDKNINLDRDVSIRCNGIYSYRITDPIRFYKGVCGNVENTYDRSEIDGQLKTEFISALQPAFAKLSTLGLRPSEIPAHSMELEDAMNEILTKRWSEKRGLSVVSVALNPITLTDEDLQAIKTLQDRAVLRDPGMAAATMVGAMDKAAGNPNGAMMGFMGMGMGAQAAAATGMNVNNMFGMAAQQQAQQQAQQPQQAAPAAEAKPTWTCECGAVNTAKFCSECGKPKPAAPEGWTCECGAVNKGKFCQECGKPKPAGAPLYRCDKCGWEPEDPMHPPKFCPECGDPFDDNDIKK